MNLHPLLGRVPTGRNDGETHIIMTPCALYKGVSSTKRRTNEGHIVTPCALYKGRFRQERNEGHIVTLCALYKGGFRHERNGGHTMASSPSTKAGFNVLLDEVKCTPWHHTDSYALYQSGFHHERNHLPWHHAPSTYKGGFHHERNERHAVPSWTYTKAVSVCYWAKWNARTGFVVYKTERLCHHALSTKAGFVTKVEDHQKVGISHSSNSEDIPTLCPTLSGSSQGGMISISGTSELFVNFDK